MKPGEASTPEQFVIEVVRECPLRTSWGLHHQPFPAPLFEVLAAWSILNARDQGVCVECGEPVSNGRKQVCSTSHSLRFNKRLANKRTAYMRTMAPVTGEIGYYSYRWSTASDLVNKQIRIAHATARAQSRSAVEEGGNPFSRSSGDLARASFATEMRPPRSVGRR